MGGNKPNLYKYTKHALTRKEKAKGSIFTVSSLGQTEEKSKLEMIEKRRRRRKQRGIDKEGFQ